MSREIPDEYAVSKGKMIVGVDYAKGQDLTAVALREGREILAFVTIKGRVNMRKAVAEVYKKAGRCTACGKTYAKCLCY